MAPIKRATQKKVKFPWMGKRIHGSVKNLKRRRKAKLK